MTSELKAKSERLFWVKSKVLLMSSYVSLDNSKRRKQLNYAT